VPASLGPMSGMSRVGTGRAFGLGGVALLLGWAALPLIQLGTRLSAGQAGESLAGAAVAAAAVLLLAALVGRLPLGRGSTAARVRLGAALRQRARRCRTPRQLDPDAAGRPRPRAPSPHPSAG